MAVAMEARFDCCLVTHRITLRLPRPLSEKAKQTLLASLLKTYWQVAKLICWVDSSTLRFIAKTGKDLNDNMIILRQYAEEVCRKFRALS